MRQPPRIPGAEKVVSWWGSWISFHDFHLLSLPPAEAQEGELRLHGWVTHPETDDRGFFRRSDECVVRLRLADIRAMELTSPLLPAIVFSLEVEPSGRGWSVTWDSSYGCEGRIVAGSVEVLLEPGPPDPAG